MKFMQNFLIGSKNAKKVISNWNARGEEVAWIYSLDDT